MPNIMIHEQVGYLLSKKLNINSYNYYLGLLAPDSPNIDGLAPKEERWLAHVRKKDLQEWKESLKDFYTKEKSNPNYKIDFIIGYVIHVLTDIIYDEYFYKTIIEKIKKDYNCKDAHIIMRNDMDNYSFQEISYIYDILKAKSDTYDINYITKKVMNEWKEKEISKEIRNNNSKYINEKLIKKLTKIVEKELNFILK